jgi:serine/threonine protein kinase
MGLLSGVELEHLISKGPPLSFQQILAIAIPVSDALVYLHERSLIRNDLKPSNIMITAAGRVCIIDLGTTKGMLDDRDMTVAGLIVGTPNPPAKTMVSPNDA